MDGFIEGVCIVNDLLGQIVEFDCGREIAIALIKRVLGSNVFLIKSLANGGFICCGCITYMGTSGYASKVNGCMTLI